MTTPTPPVVVPDTGVFLRASINETNVSSSLLRRAAAGEVQLCVSRELIAEVRDVLTRTEIRAKNARLDDAALETFLQEIETQSRLIEPLPQHFHYERDPDDEHILNLAIEVGAAYIVTFDKDLLDLMQSGREAERDFQARFPGITILMPGELLTRLNLLKQNREPEISPAPEQAPEQNRPGSQDRGIER